MNIWRFAKIIVKITLCFPLRGYYLLFRLPLLPLHFVLYPRIVCSKQGVRIKFALESLGVVFIKIGQSLSLKSFLFNKETLAVLSYLQDNVTPTSINIKNYALEINPAICENNTFTINKVPIACASIAQVYSGFIDGEKIAIKILKPNIHMQIHEDFKIIKFIGNVVSRFCSPVLQIGDIIQTVYENILIETNFIVEAQNLEKIRRNIITDENVNVPKIFSRYSNGKMLVMSYEEGVPLKNIIHGIHNYNRTQIAKNLIYTYLNQVYRDGVFHADMHAGNILVNKNLTLTLLDFGLICTINNSDRQAVATMIYAFISQNVELVLQTQLNAGYICEDIFTNYAYRRSMQKLSLNFAAHREFKMSDFTRELFIVMDSFQIKVPKKLLLLNKTMIYIEDISHQLDANLNPFSIINPWIKVWYRREKLKTFTFKIMKFIQLIL